MAIETQQQFETLRTKLKSGAYADRPELQAELIAAAKEWKSKSVPTGGTFADSLGKGFSFGFSEWYL